MLRIFPPTFFLPDLRCDGNPRRLGKRRSAVGNQRWLRQWRSAIGNQRRLGKRRSTIG
jgi:hypothetical protein